MLTFVKHFSLLIHFIIKCRQYGQRGKVLKDKGLFLVVQSDYHLHVGLTESISWFRSVMTLYSFFKWNGKSPSSPFLCWWQGRFCILLKLLLEFFYAFKPKSNNFPPPRPITFLMASSLKSKVNKFPYGIINQSIIATKTETFSKL